MAFLTKILEGVASVLKCEKLTSLRSYNVASSIEFLEVEFLINKTPIKRRKENSVNLTNIVQ